MKNTSLRLFRSPLITVGMFFLINPTFSLFDPLPDFIGYLMMFAGVYELAAMDDRLTMAAKKLLYLALLSGLRLIGAFTTSGADSSTIMMLCFAFSICEALLVATFITDWFDGFDYVMQRFGAFSALKNQTNTRFITGIFFYSRIAFGFLPELSAIFELRAYFDIDKSPVWKALASYKPYEIALFSLIVLIMGVYWYVNSVRYIRAIRADADFMVCASERYLEIWGEKKTNETVLRIADYCVVTGFLFCFDFTLNMHPVLPSGVSVLFFCLACLLMKKYSYSRTLRWYAIAAAVCQTALEQYAAYNVVPSVVSMNEVPLSRTLILIALSLAYAASSVLFLIRAEKQLAACRMATTELSPLENWKKFRIAYYIFIAAYTLSFIIPVINGWILWVKLASEITFIAGSISAWNKAIRVDE